MGNLLRRYWYLDREPKVRARHWSLFSRSVCSARTLLLYRNDLGDMGLVALSDARHRGASMALRASRG